MVRSDPVIDTEQRRQSYRADQVDEFASIMPQRIFCGTVFGSDIRLLFYVIHLVTVGLEPAMLADFRVADGAAAANGGCRKCRPVSPRYGVRLTCDGKGKCARFRRSIVDSLPVPRY